MCFLSTHELTNFIIIALNHTWNIPVWITPVFCQTMAAVASPYPTTLATAPASFSQDASVSFASHWDMVSIMHWLAWPWSALIVVESKWSINCRPSCAHSPSANLASWRTFTIFLLSSFKSVCMETKVGHDYNIPCHAWFGTSLYHIYYTPWHTHYCF